MKALTLNIPDSADVDSREVVMLVASRLYEQGKFSPGQTTELAGFTKELLLKY